MHWSIIELSKIVKIDNFNLTKVVTIDLSNPEACEWFKQKVIIENTINFGFKGWMADFGMSPLQGHISSPTPFFF